MDVLGMGYVCVIGRDGVGGREQTLVEIIFLPAGGIASLSCVHGGAGFLWLFV